MQLFTELLLRMHLIVGVGTVTIMRIVKSDQHNHAQWCYYSARDWAERCNIPLKKATLLAAGLTDTTLFERECSLIEQAGAQLVSYEDPCYPALLRTITVPPPLLYVTGEIPTNSAFLAVVGSRSVDQYGVQVGRHITSELLEYNVTVVSGGARGIDTVVHESVIAAGGRTIAVLGSGLLQQYPRENKRLFASVVATGGAVITPFSCMARPEPGNFPVRNRIIAGMSKAVVVIRAAARSGALITAAYARDEGRDVCAVPGRIDDVTSEGCHRLIQEGAQLVHTAHDIAAATGLSLSSQSTNRVLATSLDASDSLLQLCREPRSIEEIAYYLELPLEVVQQKLLTYQLAGQIEQLFDGRWAWA